MTDWIDIESKYYMQVTKRQPVVIQRGDGCWVWDVDGNEYLDFTAGWAVNNLGHCHPAVTNAIQEQASTLLHTSNQFYSLPQLKLAQLLVDHSCLDRVFFSNSGAEANEGAVKLARKYGRGYRNGAYEVITALDSFHGRTLGMVAATGQPHYQEAWKPLLPGFVNVPFDDIESVKKATTDITCAVMLEVVQGEGGVNLPSDGYLRSVRQWCNENNLLMIMDEIQTGLGRLGTLFGYQRFDVEPDVMTLAKGLGGGVPIGAVLCKEQANVLGLGDHGSTFGGNPLTCAAACASIRHMIDHDVPGHAFQMGEYMQQKLSVIQMKYEAIVGVRGIGLLLAVEFRDNMAANVVASSNREGVLLNQVRPNAVRIMPPLTITSREIDEGLDRFEKGLVQAVDSYVVDR